MCIIFSICKDLNHIIHTIINNIDYTGPLQDSVYS